MPTNWCYRPRGRAVSFCSADQSDRENDDVKRTAKQNNSSSGARSVGFDASPMWIHLPVLSVCSNMPQGYTLESSPESSGLPLLQARTLCGVSLTLEIDRGRKFSVFEPCLQPSGRDWALGPDQIKRAGLFHRFFLAAKLRRSQAPTASRICRRARHSLVFTFASERPRTCAVSVMLSAVRPARSYGAVFLGERV